MAELIERIPANLTEYPNAFKRQGAFPLEAYSVFATLEAAETYARTNPIAYAGQVIAVSKDEEVPVLDENGEQKKAEDGTPLREIVRKVYLYVIENAAGNLVLIGGTDENADALNERIKKLELFFDRENIEKANNTIDSILELEEILKTQDGKDFIYDTGRRLDRLLKIDYENDAEGNIVRDENGNPIEIGVSGLVPDLYKTETVIDGDGKETIRESGIIINKINELYKETETEDENGEKHVEYSGKVVDYVANAIPIATATRLGRVKSVDTTNAIAALNKVFVHYNTEDENDPLNGVMEVYSLSTDKLEQGTKTLILDCGTSTEPLN